MLVVTLLRHFSSCILCTPILSFFAAVYMLSVNMSKSDYSVGLVLEGLITRSVIKVVYCNVL